MEQTTNPPSPSWGTNTKLVVALTIIVILGALLVKFQFIITPLVIGLVLSYLFHPLADFMQRKLRFSWNASVGVIYIVILILLLGLLTLGGVGLVQQIQSLVIIVQDALRNLPELIENISGQVYQFGPFKLDFGALDLNDLSSQVLGMVQPLLSQTGNLLGTVAGGAANFLGWTLFVLLVSYFVLAESGGLRDRILSVEIPGYNQDLGRLSRELGRIWNAFLRGQIIIFFLTVIVYSIVLGVLGVYYAIALAFLAGLARFVPYVGPAINWGVLAIIAYFQVYKLFGMSPLAYMLLVLAIALFIDQIFDNIVSPRILSDALKVHPAAVLAAPILATTMLLWRYTMRKMLDLDPWPEKELNQSPPPPGSRLFVTIRRFLRDLSLKLKKGK